MPVENESRPTASPVPRERSTETAPPEPRRRSSRTADVPLLTARLALWLAVLSFGSVLWVINGGFSVIGLEELCSMFNEAGRQFWQLLAAITFSVPIIETEQPLIPWIGVVSATILQIVLAYLKLANRDAPTWLITATLVLSGYDLASTFAGLNAITWLGQAHWFIRGIIAIILTFLVEFTIAIMLAMARK
jgi:hypothetical protein